MQWSRIQAFKTNIALSFKGEHIDYNNYSVLPAALEQAIFIAVGLARSPRDEKIQIASEDEKLP